MTMKIILILFVVTASTLAEFDIQTNEKEETGGIFKSDNVNASRLYKRDLPQINSKNVHAAVFDGIFINPVVKVLRGIRISPRWYITLHNNALKFGVHTQITFEHIITALREIMQLRGDNRDIIILSGGHGNEIGNNWVRVINPIFSINNIPKIIRAPWHNEPDFWVRDVERFMERLDDEFWPLRSRIIIVDIAEMSVYRFRDIIQSDSHVILGFNFGRNDRAFRYYLNLRPVVSVVHLPPL